MKPPVYRGNRQMNRNSLGRIWDFLKDDTWQSWIVSLILLVILIRFIFFPALSFVTNSRLPLVVIESCSLYHEDNFDEWWNNKASWYESHGIKKSDFRGFPYKNGLNKGDIIFVWGRSDYELGEIIIFEPNSESIARHPIIHRIVSTEPLATKGDHNSNQLTVSNNGQRIDETNISEDRIIGKSVVRVPFIGWLKLIFFEPFRAPSDRGFCE